MLTQCVEIQKISKNALARIIQGRRRFQKKG